MNYSLSATATITVEKKAYEINKHKEQLIIPVYCGLHSKEQSYVGSDKKWTLLVAKSNWKMNAVFNKDG